MTFVNSKNRENMPQPKKTTSATVGDAAIEEALTRLERAVLRSESREQTSVSEQAHYIEQLEIRNKKLARENEEMKKHCATLKDGYMALEQKCQRLEAVNDSAEKELTATLRDLDHLIAQKSLH